MKYLLDEDAYNFLLIQNILYLQWFSLYQLKHIRSTYSNLEGNFP